MITHSGGSTWTSGDWHFSFFKRERADPPHLATNNRGLQAEYPPREGLYVHACWSQYLSVTISELSSEYQCTWRAVSAHTGWQHIPPAAVTSAGNTPCAEGWHCRFMGPSGGLSQQISAPRAPMSNATEASCPGMQWLAVSCKVSLLTRQQVSRRELGGAAC